MLRAETPTLRSRLRVATTPTDWRTSVILLASLVVLLGSYRSVIQTYRWLLPTVLVAALVLATCALVRALGVALPWLFGLVVWLLALVWVFVPGSTHVLLPTPTSMGALGDLLVDGMRIVNAEEPPIAYAEPLAFMLAAAFGLLALVLDFVALGLRRAVVVGALYVGAFVFPAAVSGDRPNLWVFLGVGALWLVLLRADARRRHGAASAETVGGTVSSVVVAAAALALSIGMPPVLPHVSDLALSWGSSPPGAFDRGINPMIELGQNLRRGNPVQALTYTTSDDRAPYLKVANLLDFNGKVWRPSERLRYSAAEGMASIDNGVKKTLVRTEIKITGLRSPMLPMPYPAIRAEGTEGRWNWEAQGLTLSSDSASSYGQSYRATSLKVEPTQTQLEASVTVVGPTLRAYTRLPRDIDPVIERTARAVTDGADSNYDKAIALQEYFRNGDFVYSETAPVSAGYDGPGVDVIAKFLKAKSGYCVHFASAMAVMARALDIPARIAVGYAPGSVLSRDKEGRVVYEVTSDDLHAWPELFFSGIGWLSFDPTPGVGDPEHGPNAAPGAQSPSDRLADLGSRAVHDRTGDVLLGPDGGGAATATSARTQIGAGLGGLLVLALSPFMLRRWQRARRLRLSGRCAIRLWLELEGTARDHGMFVTAAESPRTFAAELARRPGLDGEALGRLLAAVERERFGPPGAAGGDVADLRAVLGSLRASAGRAERVRAALLPVSLFGRTPVNARPIVG